MNLQSTLNRNPQPTLDSIDISIWIGVLVEGDEIGFGSRILVEGDEIGFGSWNFLDGPVFV